MLPPDMRAEKNLHPEGLTPKQEALLSRMFDIGAIKIGPRRWKLHTKDPNAPLAPMYFNERTLQRDVEKSKRLATDVYIGMLRDLDYDLIAGIPQAATPIVSSVCDALVVGQITPRMDNKGYGSGDSNDGFLAEDSGKIVAVLDDVATIGASKIQAIESLESDGLIVRDVLVLLDYGFLNGILKSSDDLREYKLHSAFSVEQLLDFYFRIEKITKKQFQEATSGIHSLREYAHTHPENF